MTKIPNLPRCHLCNQYGTAKSPPTIPGQSSYTGHFDTIPDNGAVDAYMTALAKLEKYFLPKKNIDFEIYQFRKATPNHGEAIDQFATRLRTLAATCEFPDVRIAFQSDSAAMPYEKTCSR